MSRCWQCKTYTNKLYKFEGRQLPIWVCTACNSRLNNGPLLSRSSSFNRLKFVLNLAYVVGNLVTVKGKKLLLGTKK